MSFAFRGGYNRLEIEAAFEGARVDELTRQTVLPLVATRGTRVLCDRTSGIKLGLTVTPKGDPLVWTDGPLAALARTNGELAPVASLVKGAAMARDLARLLRCRLVALRRQCADAISPSMSPLRHRATGLPF